MRTTTARRLTGVAAACLLALVTGCGTSSDDETTAEGDGAAAFTPPDVPLQKSLGDPEGRVSILAWPGYAEDGSTDKSVDWVTPFEKQSGCQADVKYFGAVSYTHKRLPTSE